MSDAAIIRRYRERIEELEEEVRQLKASYGDEDLIVSAVITRYRLTLTEARLCACLARARGRLVSRELLMEELYGEDFGADDKIIDIYVAKCRRKGVDIVTHWGRGRSAGPELLAVAARPDLATRPDEPPPPVPVLRHSAPWRAEEIQWLLKAKQDGLTAAQASQSFVVAGFEPRTRNAIIGKLRRLGLSRERRKRRAPPPQAHTTGSTR